MEVKRQAVVGVSVSAEVRMWRQVWRLGLVWTCCFLFTYSFVKFSCSEDGGMLVLLEHGELAGLGVTQVVHESSFKSWKWMDFSDNSVKQRGSLGW